MGNERVPSDALLLELGRFVWEAINLEQDVYAVCHLIDPRGVLSWGAEPASTRIRLAREALAKLDDAALQERADYWLREADEALGHRNSVLHAVPLTLSPPDDGATRQDWLAHYPRKPTGAVQMHPLTEDGLRQLREQLAKVRHAGDPLSRELVEKSWRRGAGGEPVQDGSPDT